MLRWACPWTIQWELVKFIQNESWTTPAIARTTEYPANISRVLCDDVLCLH